jgi:hypothetical protein
MRRRAFPAGDVLAAAVVAGVFSGAPSTAHAVLTGRSPLAAARAAGSLLGSPGLVRGGIAHGGLSLLWSAVLAALLPRGREVAGGAVAGLAIAAVDLAVIGRRYPAIAALPPGPQVLDHVAFGALAGATLAHRRRTPAPRSARAGAGSANQGTCP